jgi:hypothetical protein
MSFFLTGSAPINSTFAPATDPSTTTLLAELDSSNFLLSANATRERIYGVNVWVGGSTGAYWVCEHATSTAVNSTSVVDRVFFRTASGQTSQFVHKFRLTNRTDRIRLRHVSSVTGVFEAKLQAEELA